ncbi:MAG: DNA polymerase III subunit delta [Verrucomicrobiota bacterium]
MPAAKSKTTAAICAVLGSDESEVKRIAKELADEMTPAGGGDFACDLIEGTSANADDAAARIRQTVDALLTFPFFGGEKLVWLKNANFLGDSVTGRASAVQEALESLLAVLNGGLGDGIRFLISASEVDKRRTFYKTLSKLGKVEVHDKLDTSKSGWEEAAMELARDLSEPLGLTFTPEALELVAIRTGGDRRTLLSEVEKLSLYVSPERSTVTEEDVSLMVPMTGATIIFELGNALAARNTHRSLQLFEQLITQEESPIGILLVAIIPTFRNLLAVKDLMERHRLTRPAQPFFFGKTLEKLPPEATEHLPRKKDGTVNAYSLGIAAQHTHRYQLNELRAAQRAVLEANVSLVTGSQDPVGLLRQLIIRITAA